MQDENTSFHASFPVSLASESVTEVSIVPVQQPLTPQEVERICKAFIRLITAKEIQPNGNNR